jgi:signal transduction histidine kinase
MTKATFRFSPAILARLGEELNQSADQSILELVKNSYDANANFCKIELLNTSAFGGQITIEDDGDGMSAEGIEDSWLVLGKSEKSNSVATRLGRRPAGSKGLGRLAALRMGKLVQLTSVERGNSRRRHELSVDWLQYEQANVVEDIELDITTYKNNTRKNGVSIVLKDLRSPLRTEEVKRLARSLLLLTDPFGDKKNGFQVELIAPEFKETAELLSKKYFEQSDYHLDAKLDVYGRASARVLDWQGKSLATANHDDLRRKKNELPYRAPKTNFDLWVFLLNSSASDFSARRVTKGEVTDWLNTFGGVHIYQDDIRVAPYGNRGNDWLEMNLARVRNPEERPSTNTSIGRIIIPGASKFPLRQKTDRTGFIEDDTFDELKEFAHDAMNWMARWRLERAERRRRASKEAAPKAAGAQKEKVEAVIAQLKPEDRSKVLAAFSGYEKSRDKEADELRKDVQLYRTLSTAGITAATFSHESQGNPLKIIDLQVNALASRIPRFVNKEPDRSKLLEPVDAIRNASTNLATLGTATLSLIRSSKRRIGRVSIHEVLERTIALMNPFLSGRDTVIALDLEKSSPYLRTSEAALESIVTNMINNSLTAFERAATKERKIEISTMCSEKEVSIVFSDSGPGIVDLNTSEIWLPGATTNPDGTGLGLTIVKDTVKDLGGKVGVLVNGALGGAEFTVQLPILGN